MEVVFFTYQKPNEKPSVRFVAVTYNDSRNHLQGFDLSDYQLKTFLHSRMKDSPTVVASIADHQDVKLIDRQELFRQLGYGAAEQDIVKSFAVQDEQLAKVLADIVRLPVVAVGHDHFLVQQVKSLKLAVTTKSSIVYVVVRPGKVEFTDENGVSISTDEFTRQVLS